MQREESKAAEIMLFQARVQVQAYVHMPAFPCTFVYAAAVDYQPMNMQRKESEDQNYQWGCCFVAV